jgi:uncharacterized membrane protein/mono/diheme cytochrome c family protein
MQEIDLLTFIGHFHPVLVHLPVGILLWAIVLQWLSKLPAFASLAAAVPVTYLVGAVMAILSCASGWLLSDTATYPAETLNLHKWLGIGVAVIALILYYIHHKQWHNIKLPASVILISVVMAAGHFGGTLTHGEGYLTMGLGLSNKKDEVKRKNIANIQEALVYQDVVQPILEQKCYSCHAEAKQKGGLRLDNQEWMMKGGEDGIVLQPGNAEGSEIYKRIVLDPIEEKHMPPKGKLQLSDEEKRLMQWWISSGASFHAKAKEIAQTEQIKKLLTGFQGNDAVQEDLLPETAISPASEEVVLKLQQQGVAVYPVSKTSNYLSVSFVAVPELDQNIIALLRSISKQVLWLKMPGVKLDDAVIKAVAGCSNLRRLSIEHSGVTDVQLEILNSLTSLRYLNIADNKISFGGLQKLNQLKQVKQLYLFQTQVLQTDVPKLHQLFPSATIDLGNYKVETLVTDTQVLRVVKG